MNLLTTVAVVIRQRQPENADMLAEARAALLTVANWIEARNGHAYARQGYRDVAQLIRLECKDAP